MTAMRRNEPSTWRRVANRGFTLVELMVAVTGGLFVSVIVFAMARQGTRFYQQETRVAEATLAATIGMQRLRADVGRAGYMASPYIGGANSDPNVCVAYGGLNIPLLENMRSIQVVKDPTIDKNADLKDAGITPDQIIVGGSFQSADRFIAGYLQANAGLMDVPLQPNIGALARYRYSTVTNQQELLSSLFPTGRLLRLVNQYGRVAYGVITSVSPNGDLTGSLPTIKLAATPAIPTQGPTCVFTGVGIEVNVVNFYRYRIADLQSDATSNAFFRQVYASSANPADKYRTELIREELDPTTGNPFANTQPEIVAEYAVDLRFEAAITPTVGPDPNSLAMTPGAGDIHNIAAQVPTSTAQPQRIKSIRARLSVRSREADRNANVAAGMTGLYRLGVGDARKTSFARVRTVQTDIAIPNHFGAW